MCAGKLVTIHACAAALYSDKAHRHWDRGETLGVDRLRQKIFRALNTYELRLHSLETCEAWAGVESNQRPRDYDSGGINNRQPPAALGTITT